MPFFVPRLLALARASAHVIYLGNMGVLITGAGKSVVIDGLHHGELAEYASVPPSLLDPLENARSPFAAIDLFLTTHRHRDHFNAQSVGARLRADQRGVFIAAQETVDSVLAAPGLQALASRMRGLQPRAGGSITIASNGVTVEVLDLPHNPTRSTRVANVGFIVTMGELRILHTGDANPDSAAFAVHRLRGRVDVAIVPFWYLNRGNDAVRRAIGARTWIASHIPLSDTASVRKDVMGIEPGALLLARPGERHLIR